MSDSNASDQTGSGSSFLKRVDLSVLKGLGGLLSAKALGEHLVFCYDGYAVSGALVRLHGGKAELLCVAMSVQTREQKAIEEILAQFRAQKIKRWPKSAILATAEVGATSLDLPVSARTSRQQLQNLISWELESNVAEIAQLWSIGSLLEGFGFITAEQRQNAGVELELSRSQNASMIRFGEICIQLGYISRDQLNEVMKVQERLLSIEGQLDCAWQEPKVDEDAENQTESDLWFGSGIYRHNRHLWVEAFARNSLKLKSIVPLHGLSSLFIEQSTFEDHEQIVAEIFKERVVVLRFVGRVTVSVNHLRLDCKDDQLNVVTAAITELMRPETDEIWLNSVHADGKAMCEALERTLGKDVKYVGDAVSVTHSGSSVPQTWLYRYAALAQLEAGHKRNNLPFIAAQDPRPPLWKNKNVWRYSMPVLAVLALGLNEGYMQYRLAEESASLAKIEAKKEEQVRLAQQIGLMVAETNKEKEKLQEITTEVEAMRKQVLQMKALSERNPLLMELLLSLQESINDFVVVDRFVESNQSERTKQKGFELQGWALNDNAAQLFSRELNKRVAKLGYEVLQVKINRSIGRSGIRGYGLSLWLLPKNKAEARAVEKRAETSVAKGVDSRMARI
ncbi:hypothetical protein [Thiomicrorhabdus sp.]|uniref:hypothetical protein n=1 Tax=Thiomicrorhabdus sp. TaxID=2039724 RepID=UPI0029C86FF4|nr:hypothetical protein [Thiomicrorhabdus sp.]